LSRNPGPLAPLALITLLAGLPACLLPPQPVPAASAPAASGGSGQVAVLTEQVNSHRRSIGCPPLEWDPAVARAAQGHSNAMRLRGFYGHTDPEGRDLTDRLRDAGVPWVAAAENIARTGYGAEQVLYLWLQSRGHRENIENCRFTRHGVGLAGDYWTHLFVTPDPRAGGARP
jgi:uncharacterized protein YkwD